MPCVQHHMRVIMAWREPTAQALWRELRARCPWLDVTYTQVSVLDQYLKARDYYHILYVSPVDWNSFTPTARRKFANRVKLLVLGPGPAAPAELTDAHASVYFPHAIPEAEAVDCLVKWHTCLAEGSAPSHCDKASGGRLAFAGDETCLDIPETVTAQAAASGEPDAGSMPESLPLRREAMAVVLEEDWPSIRRQLAEARENLRLIEERQAEFVLSTDIPLQLVKERRRLLDRIVELERQLAELTVPNGPDPRRDSMESTPEHLRKTLVGIPPGLSGQLRATLLRCGPFGSDDELRALFTDARIAAWRDTLPEAASPAGRAIALIAFLYDRYSDSQQNALVLLLHVLSDLVDPGDACHRQLAELASELESLLGKRGAI